MRTLGLYLWMEWREHRLALLAVAGILLALMTGAWFLAPPLVLRDPLFPSSSCVVVVLISLLAVGGELLSERREGGLRWLERMPAGLVTPFWSKLCLLVVTTFAAGALGLGLAYATAWTRGVAPEEMGTAGLVALVVSLHFALWTFASSSWTSRSVIALFGAGFVLAGLGVPAWVLAVKGYRFETAEFAVGMTILLGAALPSAWLGFVKGGRFGRAGRLGSGIGLAAAVASFAPIWGWAAWQLHLRDRIDPQSEDFELVAATVSTDGRFALVHGRGGWRWEADRLPLHALRVDLELGTHELLGTTDGPMWQRARETESGLLEFHDLVLQVAERPEPLVFELESGRPLAWDGKSGVGGILWRGLGQHFPGRSRAQGVIRDPFRSRAFSVESLGVDPQHVLVRPGRWLWTSGIAQPPEWSWLDPESGERTATGWPEGSRPLVLFTDGRILLANAAEGLQVVHPEAGSCATLDTLGVPVDCIYLNWNGTRVPEVARSLADAEGTILLRTCEPTWLVLDADATSVRRLDVPWSVRFLVRTGPDTAIVHDSSAGRLERLDLATGARTVLWPARPES